MPPSTKPKLELKTPLTSTFPSELSATFPSALSASFARSPLPGYADFIKQEEGLKTPITPPLAYTDFLKSMASPISGDKSGRTSPTSAPSTGSSEHSECSCNCDSHKSPTSATPGHFVYPSSAPSTAKLARLRIPPSPAFTTGADSPLSATSAIRSPFSARSARSPFDWDFKSKSRPYDIKSPKVGRSSIRQVREIVTRTVTYTTTPRMSPAPKGKRRKIED